MSEDDLDLNPVECHSPGGKALTPLEILRDRKHPDLIKGSKRRNAQIARPELRRVSGKKCDAIE